MTHPISSTPLHRSLIAATAGAALALASGAQAQVLSDGGPSASGSFDVVLDYPGAALPLFGVDDVGDATGATLTQVNLNAGNAYLVGFDYHFTEVNFYAPSSATSGNQNASFINSELNLINGEIGVLSSFDAASTLNMSGGTIGNAASISGTANVSGGTINSTTASFASFNGTLNLSGAGFIGIGAQATNGSTVNMSGGEIDNELFLLNGSVLNLTGGVIGKELVGTAFRARAGSQVNMSGGTVGQIVDIDSGGVLDMIGGVMGRGIDVFGVANISGGTVQKWGDVESGGIINITGGTLEFGFDVKSGGTINISGGMIDGTDFDVDGTGMVNLTGTAFFLDGSAIASGTVVDRDAILTGTLLDGSAISLNLASTNGSGVGYFASDSILTVTVVPEPGSLALLGLGGLAMVGRRRR